MDANLADDLWTMGAGHLLGAQALIKEATRQAEEKGATDIDQAVFNGGHSASIHLLVGYSFELLLKSAYILHGGSKADLGPKGLGHDLLLALDEAKIRGFVSKVPKLRFVVERLREMHLRHQFRYGGMEKFQMPALDESVPTLEALAKEIGSKLRTIAVRGRMPLAESGLTIRRPRRH